MKTCARCDENLPLESFGLDSRMTLGRSSYCGPCKAAYARERYAKNPERARATQRAYATRTRTPEQTRMRHLKNKYGLSLAQYKAMVQEQGGRCAICGTTDPRGRGDWHVDHCHDTGMVRALLCSGCNVGIAQLAHNPVRLRAAAEYLERHQEQS